MRNFFGLQYRAARRGDIPVSQVDHPLDNALPFCPGLVGVYLDFTAFWLRTAGFALKTWGRRALPPTAAFLSSMGRLYAFAAEVYRRRLSTTERPRRAANAGFLLIHAFDPHLMCVPSLHVMVVIRAYTWLRETAAALGGGRAGEAVEAARQRALAITGAVLLVKQHSVNCIAAAMYAMTRFDGALFPAGEAEAFAAGIFAGEARIPQETQALVRGHILALYRRFLAEGETAPSWEQPLLDFLARRAGLCP
jgi:hypothetical protein